MNESWFQGQAEKRWVAIGYQLQCQTSKSREAQAFDVYLRFMLKMEVQVISSWILSRNGLMAVGLILLGFLYLYFRDKFKYWERRGVTGPHFNLFIVFRNLYVASSTPVHEIWRNNHKLHGNFYGTYEFTIPRLIVSDPDILRDIMVKNFHVFPDHREFPSTNKIFRGILFNLRGENWRNVRHLMSPTFTSGKMRQMYQLMNDCADDVVKALEVKAEKEGDIDLKVLFGNYSLDVIARCCFATNANVHQDENNEFTKNVSQVFQINKIALIFLLLLPKFLFRLTKLSLFSGNTANFFKNVTLHLMGERKQKGVKKNDFLQLLIDAEHDPSDAADVTKEDDDLLIGNNGSNERVDEVKFFKKKKLDEDEIVAQSFLFFIAGYETTSTLLKFLFYSLALHPEIQEKLFEEIKEAMESNKVLTHDVLQGLPYLNAVVSETLRFYPPLTQIDRETAEDCKLEKTDTVLPKGFVVIIPVYAIHHDPENFPEPEEFRPERFLPENKESIKPFTYMPFGAGPRQCIAYRFALLEAKLAVAKVLLNFKFTRIAKTDVPPIYDKFSNLMQCKALVVGFERRV